MITCKYCGRQSDDDGDGDLDHVGVCKLCEHHKIIQDACESFPQLKSRGIANHDQDITAMHELLAMLQGDTHLAIQHFIFQCEAVQEAAAWAGNQDELTLTAIRLACLIGIRTTILQSIDTGLPEENE